MPNRRRDGNVFFHARFDVPALLRLAGRLRNRPCTCDISQQPSSGSLNWAIILSFDDGVEWIFRSPRKSYCIDQETAGILLASEAATLKYIRKKSSIPVPEVFHYSCTGSNEIGVPFILMSKAQGSPLSTRSWESEAHHPLNSLKSPYRCLTQEEKEKVMKQLGTIVSQLSHLRLDKIGSLFEEEGRYVVKNCLSPGFVLRGRCTVPDINRGPFLQESDYYGSLLSAFVLHTQDLLLEHHLFFAPVPIPTEYNSYASYLSATDRWNDFATVGSKVNSSKNRLDYFIAGRFLEGMIPSFTIKSHELPNGYDDGFPIRHPDLSVSNIFVDDDCNITCIIDWAFASSVPMAELLTTPGLPHPRDDTEPSLTAAFRAGFTNHFGGGESKILHPAIWETSRKVWLFTRLINLDALQDYNHFKELYALTFGEQTTDITTLFKEQYKKSPISDMAKFLEAFDQPPSAIQRDEKAYFSCVGPERHALSRKLGLASALSRGFVANRNLWQWIENTAYTNVINKRVPDTEKQSHIDMYQRNHAITPDQSSQKQGSAGEPSGLGHGL